MVDAGLSSPRRCPDAARTMNRPALLAVLLPALSFADEPTPASRVASVWHEAKRLRVWALYPVEKAKADEALPLTRKLDELAISAARGEHEPFIVVLGGESPLREVRVAFGDLAGPGGAKIAAANLSARRIAYIYVDEPSGARMKQPMPFDTGTGLFPDPLPGGDGALRPGRNLQFWADVHVPREATPGIYKGEVLVRFRREGWMSADAPTELRLPLAVRVRSFALPERSPLLNTAFFNIHMLRPTQRTPEWLREWSADFSAHRQTPQPMLPSPLVTVGKDGSLAIDSDEWEKSAAHFLDELHAPFVFLPVWATYPDPTMQGLYFIHHFPAAMTQKWFGAPIATEQRTLTPEFRAQFGAYLRHMHALLARRGWLDRVFITTMDEPYTYHTADRARDVPANNYELIRNFVAFVRETAPGLKTFCTADPVPELEGFIDHWCLRNLDHAAAARARAEQHGEVVTFCDNYRTFVDFPAVSARTLGWLAWKIGARGWLTYETLGDLGSAWEGPALTYPIYTGGTVWGMGQMFYPDTKSDALVSSIRWEMMREGCDDYEYLTLLRERCAARPDDEAARILATAAGDIVGGAGDPETSSGVKKANVQSNLTVHELRERVADLIEKLAP